MVTELNEVADLEQGSREGYFLACKIGQATVVAEREAMVAVAEQVGCSRLTTVLHTVVLDGL